MGAGAGSGDTRRVALTRTIELTRRILLLSAYGELSHQRWRQILVNHLPEYDWTVLTLPARYFIWRFRGNAQSWAVDRKALLTHAYIHMITTSMTDLSSHTRIKSSIYS